MCAIPAMHRKTRARTRKLMAKLMANAPASKLVSAAEAVNCIQSGSVLAVDGFVGSVCPEELLTVVEQRFLETGQPANLTVWASTGSGDTRGKGLDRLHHDGIVRRLVVSYLNLNRKLQKRL